MRPARTPSQNGRRSRAKGAAFEREVARALAAVYPAAERCIAQSRSARREGCDVEGTPFWIECKVGARPNVLEAMRQAVSDSATDGRPPIVIAQATRQRPIVAMELEAFLGLALRSSGGGA